MSYLYYLALSSLLAMIDHFIKLIHTQDEKKATSSRHITKDQFVHSRKPIISCYVHKVPKPAQEKMWPARNVITVLIGPLNFKLQKKSYSVCNIREPHREKTYFLSMCIWSEPSLPAWRNFAYPKGAQWRFWSACANAQADLNLRWAHMSKGTLSDILARFVL